MEGSIFVPVFINFMAIKQLSPFMIICALSLIGLLACNFLEETFNRDLQDFIFEREQQR